jgi:PAS domain S-box-containing protein
MPKSMPRSEPPAVLRYGAAITAVAAAVAASLLQQVVEITPVVSLLLCGVVFAAWFGGLGPGLLAITLGLLAFDYFFLPPLYSLAVQSHNDVLRLIAFGISALFVVALSARQESAAQSLRWAHADLQTIIETIPAYVVRYRADGTPDFVNQTLREFVGPGVGHDGMRSAVHPDDLSQNLRDWRAHVAAGEPYENEMRLRRADGAYRWLCIKRVPLRDANGAIVSWYGAGHDIDDLKRAEAALRESEQNLQTIIDTIPAHVMRYRSDGTSDFMNQTMRQFIGPGVVLDGKNSTVHPEDYPQRLRDWRAHVAAGEPYENEMRLRRADGVYRWHRVTRVALRDANGAIVNWYGVGFDIDDQKRAEAALRESEKNLQTIIDTIPAHVVRWRADGTPDFMNQTLRRFLGAGLAEVYGTAHPEDLPSHLREWHAHILTGEPYAGEIRLRRADGVYRWQHVRRVPLRDANGTIVNWYGAGYDIDDRKRAESALREREAQLAEARRELRQMIDTIPIPVASYSADARRDFVNAAWKQYTGLSDEAARGTEWSIVAHSDHIATGEKMWRDALAKGEPWHTEERVRRADGQYRWFAIDRVAARDENGNITKWYGTAYDIEDRKRAEDRLRRSRAYLDEAQRLSVTGSVGWRIADNLVVWSQETYRIFELDLAVKPTLELVLERTHPDDIELVRGMTERLVNEDRGFDYEHRLLLPDGTIKHLHVRTHRVRFESGEVEVIGALMDITAARKAEEALRHAQAELAHASRVATLGELSASIAHEVHQPLTAIVASGNAAVRWLDREDPECARAIRSVTRMISEAHRASQVILRIRELAKKAEPDMSQVDINSLVTDVLMLINREATGQRVEVRTQLASKLPPALGDRVQLQQLLINLVMNGIQAMAPVTDRARVLVVRTQRHDADQILVAVEDTGIGIESENLDRLFGAFYTTKPDGMGMGLSISRSIVEAHGGSISATRNSGPGMTFQFTLSVYLEPATASLPVS